MFGYESEAGVRIRKRREEKDLNSDNDNGQTTPVEDSEEKKEGSTNEDLNLAVLPR